ncbi:LysR family transcriptional regulator [Kurthia senegalensis]|uniref:LysR family transcriptional regulator n=1 Tax=Kurthia senegalensis TaxID=1033740 RepID=UPI00028A2CB9|nr:LysR family transcriptional regulator [Kurthia senegalensis]
MELRQLEYFMVLSEELHFTRAAVRLHISQPTLSQQIKVLEQTVGVLLFNRIGKKITLSKAGTILYDQCIQIFSTLEQTKEQLQELENTDQETLRIGVPAGAVYDLLSLCILHYIEQFPNAKAQIIACRQKMSAMFERGEIDIGFSYEENHKINSQQIEIPLYDEELLFVTHRSHPLLQQPSLTLHDFKDEPLVLFPEEHPSRKWLQALSKKANCYVQPTLEMNNPLSMLHFIEQRLGSGIMMKSLYAQLQTPYIEARTLSIQKRKEVVLVLPKKETLSFSVKQFLPLLERFLSTKGIELKDKMSILLLSNDSFSL